MQDFETELTDSVLSGNYRRALQICREALAHPEIGPPRIHECVLLPVIRRIGQSWTEDTAGFSQVSVAHILLHRLLERLSRARIIERQAPVRLLAHDAHVMVTVAPGDTHDFGARILSQNLQMSGWPVTFYNQRQSEKVVPELGRKDYLAVAISVSCDEKLAGLADYVATCRMASNNPGLQVLIGGAAIQPPFGQYGFLGADRVGLAIDEVAPYLSDHLHAIPDTRWN